MCTLRPWGLAGMVMSKWHLSMSLTVGIMYCDKDTIKQSANFIIPTPGQTYMTQLVKVTALTVDKDVRPLPT